MNQANCISIGSLFLTFSPITYYQYLLCHFNNTTNIQIFINSRISIYISIDTMISWFPLNYKSRFQIRYISTVLNRSLHILSSVWAWPM